jgi:hypothetical protein
VWLPRVNCVQAAKSCIEHCQSKAVSPVCAPHCVQLVFGEGQLVGRHGATKVLGDQFRHCLDKSYQSEGSSNPLFSCAALLVHVMLSYLFNDAANEIMSFSVNVQLLLWQQIQIRQPGVACGIIAIQDMA